jgi:archaellum biogenesis ATPase FlaH
MTQSVNPPQILLEPEQYEMLQQIAQAQGSTVVAVVQEVLRLGLESLQKQKQQRREALQRLNRIRQEIQQTHGMIADDLVAQVRREREAQIEQMLNDSP